MNGRTPRGITYDRFSNGHIKIIFILYLNGANCITSILGVTLKGKNLLLKGANSFP